MNWPWSKQPEKRESSFTDALVQQILSTATGASLAVPSTTGALETCAGLVSRAFASAEVKGPMWAQAALSPACLSMIGRSLIRSGEIVLVIDASDGELMLWPAADFDVYGAHDPATWTYRVNMAGPSFYVTRDRVASAGVCHFQYARDPHRPWRGVGPLESAQLAGRLSAETVKALADESSGPRGSLLPIPGKDGEDPTVELLKGDIKKLNGQIALTESTSTMQVDRPSGSASDWQTRRLGASPPAALVELATMATREIMAACGISPALFDATAGASAREAYRQVLHGVIAPLGRIVAAELSTKLEADIMFEWAELRAGDIAGRARAFQSMVGAGMDLGKAAALAGLMTPEEP